MKRLLLFTLAATGWFLIACSSDSKIRVPKGVWRATLQTKGGELPFGLDIVPNADSATYTVYALNGSERLRMDTATVSNDTLRIPMRLFESEIIAKISNKRLEGIFRRRRTGNEYVTMPFAAYHGLKYRFEPEGKTAAANLTGKWAATFRSEGDSTGAVGLFNQNGNKVTGTFLTSTGDYRYLEGNVFGDSLLLSCFDGTHVFLFKARRQPNGTLTGGFWSGATGYESWTARLDPAAALPDETTLTYLKPGYKTISFSFPDVSGKPVSLQDERFKNKVVIVQILGSWCPNCMDETNYLSPWYKKNRNRGVEIVGLAYEKSADLTESAPKLQRMINRFGIDYPVLLAGTNDKAAASRTLPAINRVVGFPTTIFIDKRGNVREIHTGFSGPGTGVYYDKFVEDFNRLVDKLVAEKI
ncbi:TlpA disulfide reductase family protein [Tellurirhabdus rosea]|uniref:TlpA disulfide reductase family protein n=1 Tax=Tellurirhabdus rosea TaxID=2674997 RepID=UPI00224D6A58|nr:TlpA disulfide reductase family protein [Tellurirhabdus rosea]